MQEARVKKIESEIHDLEARHSALVQELEQQATYEKPGRAVELNRELLHLQERLAALTPEWEKEAEKLQELG